MRGNLGRKANSNGVNTGRETKRKRRKVRAPLCSPTSDNFSGHSVILVLDFPSPDKKYRRSSLEDSKAKDLRYVMNQGYVMWDTGQHVASLARVSGEASPAA